MLFNLLGNAVKFTFKGHVKISVDYDALDSMIVAIIEDTGVGMKEAELLKLFRFFGTLSKSKDINRGGMGLGLTISKMIVRQLGGDITVSSNPGQGSMFTFSIPVDSHLKSNQSDHFKNLLKKRLSSMDMSSNSNSSNRTSSSGVMP